MKKTSSFNTILLITIIVTLSPYLLRAQQNASPKGTLSSIPKDLHIPAMTADEKSVVLIWNKPDNYGNIVDYRVYINGRRHGLSSENNKIHSPASPYISSFYTSDTSKFHLKITYLSYTVTGLKAEKEYSFTVCSVFADGKESPKSATAVHKTIAKPRVFSIKDFGAENDGKTINTKAIQSAIDSCTPGSVVLVPAGVYKTGALFLKSDMTLELDENAVLLGSENPADYPMEKGYTLYSYSTNKRPPSLINAFSDTRAAGTFKNIRIVGKGTIDGNGWKTLEPIIGEAGISIPRIAAGRNDNVSENGVLAKNQVERAVEEGMLFQIVYGLRRSSLMTLRGVENVYISGITTLNPAFHGLIFLECKNAMLNGCICTTYDGGNADGVEFGNSENIYVLNNLFDTGDDCANFAAGTGEAAQGQQPMTKGHIFNNYFRKGHGAVVMGSHTGAWITDILSEDNIINGTDIALRCKSSDFIGGGARDIVF
jgi:exo-poly-alpha-galacturonosidase